MKKDKTKKISENICCMLECNISWSINLIDPLMPSADFTHLRLEKHIHTEPTHMVILSHISDYLWPIAILCNQLYVYQFPWVSNIKRSYHDDVITWTHFPRCWSFVRGIHRSPVNSSHKGQWRGALMFSLICVWINAWVNNHEAGDLRRYRTHYDFTLMSRPNIMVYHSYAVSRWKRRDDIFARVVNEQIDTFRWVNTNIFRHIDVI